MTPAPLILYIPGLKPKPEPELHAGQLRRCLLAGLQKTDREVASRVEAAPHAFDLVSWTYDFYGEHRDIAVDLPGINALLDKAGPDRADRAAATTWKRRLVRWIYRAGDRLPFLIPRLADENIALHLRDLRRYERDENGIAETARRHLKLPLRTAAAAGRPILLLAHSMGSVIAWDALWQLSHDSGYRCRIDLFMTLGSPLGQRYIQRRLLSGDRRGVKRYPSVIRRWINVAAVGELTALDRNLARDFAGMVEAQLVDDIEDIEIYNWYRDHGVLNVHAEYGYLAHPDTAARIAAWWRAQPAG